MKEETIVECLQNEGFREVGEPEKASPWYRIAAEPTSCLKEGHQTEEAEVRI